MYVIVWNYGEFKALRVVGETDRAYIVANWKKAVWRNQVICTAPDIETANRFIAAATPIDQTYAAEQDAAGEAMRVRIAAASKARNDALTALIAEHGMGRV